MLTYSKVNIVLSVSLALVIIVDLFVYVHPVFYVLIIIAYLAVLVWGTSVIDSEFYMKAYCSGDAQNKVIGLTFDDGPDSKVTPVVLEILKKHNIKAAFFCIGEKMAKDPELVKRISEEGHIIGNHSYTHHFFFDLFGKKKMTEEIFGTESVIRDITGKENKLFRPPYGVINPTLVSILKSNDYRVVGWSLRSKDTVIKDNNKLMKRLRDGLKEGDIVLFHDRLEYMTDVLENFINLAKSRGYSFERPDLLLNLKLNE
jgi:peptidoglycan/xylan/chitin deacetylase (PgdA/CDA1 family)